MNKLSHAFVKTEERFELLDRDGHACTRCGVKIGFYSAHIIRVRTAHAVADDLATCRCLCAECAERLVPPRESWRNLFVALKGVLLQNRGQWAG